MSNIQQSVNSLLTTGAALKTLNQDEEIRKAKAEKLDLEKQLLKEQIKNAKNAKISEAYIDVLKNPMKAQENNDFKTLRTAKDLYANSYNSNPEFAKGMKSAKDLYANSYNSLNSFEEEYINRKSDGGNKQW